MRQTTSWESNETVDMTGPRVDRTASGRKIPVRTPSLETRPRSERLSSHEMVRSRSLGSGERRPLTDSGRIALLATGDIRGDLSRSGSGSSSRRKLERRRSANSEYSWPPSPKQASPPGTAQPKADKPRDMPRNIPLPVKTPSSDQPPKPILKPILLPPLNDPTRPRTAPGKRADRGEAQSRPSSSKGSSEKSKPSSSNPQSFFKSLPLQATGPSPSLNAQPSDFAFPFQSNPKRRSVEYAEDFSNWKPREGALNPESSTAPASTWPLTLEDLAEPDRPFVLEDRHYICATPSESGLSTITEEGTIRDSIVVSPPHIVVTDTSLKGKEVDTGRRRESVVVTPISPAMANWFAQGGPEYDVDRAMTRLATSPLPGGPATPPA